MRGRDFARNERLPWLALFAVFIGVLSTLGAWLLLGMIRFFTQLFFFQRISWSEVSPATHTLGAWVIVVPAIGGMIVGLMARYGSEKIRGHGIPEALEAILFGKSRMSPKVAVLKPLSSGIVIGSGGPFGAEGPVIMTGGAAASLLAQAFHLTAAERKALLVAGACAGMTAVFGTPIAAILLAVELLLFELRPRSLLPVAVACAVAGFLRPMWATTGPLFPMQTPPVETIAIVSCIVAGLCAGALSAVMTRLLYWVEDAFERLPVHWMWWPALGGLVVGLGGWFEPRALGVGYDVIADLLAHNMVLGTVLALLAVKILIWSVALGSGTSGGVLAPLLMIGAGLGYVLSPWLPGGDARLWALVCMAATLGGTMRAPLMAILFAFELTGNSHALLPLVLGCTTAYGFSVVVMPRSILTEKIARRGLHVYREYGVDPLERSFVDEVMTREVVSIPANMAIASARATFFGPDQSHRGYPVVDGTTLLGLVRREDLASATEGRIRDVLHGIGPVAMLGETCRSVAARMAATGVERLPVVEAENRHALVGIVSRSDLLAPARGTHEDEMPRERFYGS